MYTITTIYSPTEKLRAGFNGPAYCPANLSGTRLRSWELFRLGPLFIPRRTKLFVRPTHAIVLDYSWSFALERFSRVRATFAETHSRPEKTEREKEKERGKKEASHALGNTHYLGMEERQGLVHVLDFVNSHASIIGFGQSLARDDLQ